VINSPLRFFFKISSENVSKSPIVMENGNLYRSVYIDVRKSICAADIITLIYFNIIVRGSVCVCERQNTSAELGGSGVLMSDSCDESSRSQNDFDRFTRKT